MEAPLSPGKDQSAGYPLTFPPLVVDLAGTLVKTDLLAESLFTLVKQNPFYILVLPFWLFKGRAFLKQQIARRVTLDAKDLPYHRDLLGHLKGHHAEGRKLVLATANDERIAHQVAGYLKLFDTVLDSNGTFNINHRTKRDRLVALFGEKGFDYAGNERGDLAVWSSARKAILVNTPP